MNLYHFLNASTFRTWLLALTLAGLPLTMTACGGDSRTGPDLPPLPEQEEQGEQDGDQVSDDETDNDETADTDADPLYMVGSATPGGWSLDSKEALQPQSDNTLVYEWQGELGSGEIKFANYEATDFCGGPWLLATTENEAPVEAGNAYNWVEDCPDETGASDFKWLIETAGTYQVTVDTESELIYFDLLEQSGDVQEEPDAYYSNLYLVGDATPGGWDLGSATELTVDADNPAVFTWEGSLTAGNFKVATQTDEFGGGHDWIHPSDPDQSLTATSIAVVAAEEGATDYQWSVAEEATYRIRIDLESQTIHIGAPYANLFLVGDAAPGGWSLGDAVMMTRDEQDIYLYTASVELTAGSLKIATGTVSSELSFDPGHDWIHPNMDGQPLSETAFSIVTAGEGEDYQWQISEETAGIYDITLDLNDQTVLFNKQ